MGSVKKLCCWMGGAALTYGWVSLTHYIGSGAVGRPWDVPLLLLAFLLSLGALFLFRLPLKPPGRPRLYYLSMAALMFVFTFARPITQAIRALLG